MQAPDEFAHLFRIYEVSCGAFLTAKYPRLLETVLASTCGPLLAYAWRRMSPPISLYSFGMAHFVAAMPNAIP